MIFEIIIPYIKISYSEAIYKLEELISNQTFLKRIWYLKKESNPFFHYHIKYPDSRFLLQQGMIYNHWVFIYNLVFWYTAVCCCVTRLWQLIVAVSHRHGNKQFCSAVFYDRKADKLSEVTGHDWTISGRTDNVSKECRATTFIFCCFRFKNGRVNWKS